MQQEPNPHAQSDSGEWAHLGFRQAAPHIPLLLRLRAGLRHRAAVRQPERLDVHLGLLPKRLRHESNGFLEVGAQVGDP